ncbi:MAG TPA: hypothetical protein VH415_05955 [Nitrososphaeraceae archaeon]|jgi:hypothetical protein
MTAAAATNPSFNEEKLNQFLGKILSDFGSAVSAVLGYIGDKLGLYKAMYDFGRPITSQELADVTRTSERYVREWLANQAAGGYTEYDSSSQSLSRKALGPPRTLFCRSFRDRNRKLLFRD